MLTPPECPDVECRGLLPGDTDSPEQGQRFERHLEFCPACQRRLDGAAELGEELQGLARQVGDPTRLPHDPTTARLLERLHEVRSPLVAVPGSPADLYFLRPADRPDLLGTLGPYEVQEVIGQGGMGVVLKAFEPALHRLVAIKVLAPALAGSATARRRFTREAQAAAAVCHDHVVAVHGVYEADGLPYLVMQYVAGESLQARLDGAGPLEVAEVVRIGLQTAQGLAAAHAQGLIHRDVKPANLLLEDGLAKVKVTDFGLARMADDVGLTQSGTVAGTPEYMAPEQARGEPVDHRADLFSLGSVLYAMAAGRPPFRGSTALAVLRQVSDEAPPPVRELNPEVAAWLEAVITRLMAKNPAERFGSAAEVAALLEGYLAHIRQPATVPAPELPPSPAGCRPAPAPALAAAGPWRRRPIWLLAVLVALSALGLFRWLLGVDVPPPQNGPPAEFYQDFRGANMALPSVYAWSGRDGDETIEPEDKGLRITLPAGRKRTDPVGPMLHLTVKGNFEITTGYELVQGDRPRGGKGVGYELYVMTDTPSRSAVAFACIDRADGSEAFYCNGMTTVDGKRKYTGDSFPASARSGRLRLTRQGAEVSFWAADGDKAEFQELWHYQLGPEDVNAVRLAAYPGQAEAVDVRVVDVKVHSDAPIPELSELGSSVAAGWPVGMPKGIALALTLGLIGAAALVALAVWSFRTRRVRGAAKAPAPPSAKEEAARPEAAAFVTFPCPECGKKLRVRAEQAGKKGKCPHCGQAVPVPGTDAFRAGRPPV